MNAIRLGIALDDLGLAPRRGIERAAALGLAGVQFRGDAGPLAHGELSHSGRRELAHLVERSGLRIAAVEAHALGGLDDAGRNDRIVPALDSCLALARDVGGAIVTIALGRLVEGDDPRRGAIVEALGDLSRRAEFHGVVLAARAGDEDPAALARFLQTAAGGTVRADFDPGELAVRGGSPAEGARVLAPWIVHAQARDGTRGRGDAPLGDGDVPWAEYLAELAAVGYDGFHVIRAPASGAGVERAARFLRALAGGSGAGRSPAASL